jgi:hypothetical protein
MHAAAAADDTVEAPQLNLPPDLVQEISRRSKGKKNDFQVDGWKPSLLERITALFGLR